MGSRRGGEQGRGGWGVYEGWGWGWRELERVGEGRGVTGWLLGCVDRVR